MFKKVSEKADHAVIAAKDAESRAEKIEDRLIDNEKFHQESRKTEVAITRIQGHIENLRKDFKRIENYLLKAERS